MLHDKNRLGNIGSFVILILTPLLAFLPVTIGQHPLVYDIVTTALPWRYFIGDCLQHGQLPLWNPYQHLGYPIHADPQSGAWYLPAWIIGTFAGYDFYTLSFEFLAHIILAGFGMRWLAYRLQLSNLSGTLLGVAYASSGFFVGNAQHLPFLISAAWLPFIIAGFIRLAETRRCKHMIPLTIFFWLSLTGGYPGFTIILSYFLLILLVYYGISLYMKSGRKAVFRLLLLISVAGAVTLLLALPFLVSFFQSLPYITRGGGTSLQQALVCPFSPQSAISFIFPLAAVAEPAWFNTDLSMTNAYIGLIPFALFLFSLTRKDHALKWIFLGFAFFSLVSAMGEYLPVRSFQYHFFPLMNYFRMPAIFRIFVILGFLVGAGYALDHFMKGDLNPGRKFLRFLIGFFILICITFAVVLLKHDQAMTVVFGKHLFSAANGATVSDNLLINSVLIITLGLLGLVLAFSLKRKINFGTFLLFFTMADLSLAANLNGPYTVYTEKTSLSDINRQTENFPEGFPTPGFHPVNMNRDAFKSYKDLWINLNCFYKQIGYEGYNPFALKSFEDLVFERPDAFARIILHPPYFLKKQPVNQPVGLSFKPDQWIIEVTSAMTDTLCLLQNDYPGWHIRVNHQAVQTVLYEGTFLSVPVTAGKSLVEFSYDPAMVVWSWVVSVVVIFLLTLALLIPWVLSLLKIPPFSLPV
ncbi:MAG TPA: hypothetical protein P5531_03325 [Bacteroidales bacterium]|nr:hypothetical protein [Bacteroidales bacterium]HSA42449.1 hypothetical protein [Bacteroidales bacterium]